MEPGTSASGATSPSASTSSASAASSYARSSASGPLRGSIRVASARLSSSSASGASSTGVSSIGATSTGPASGSTNPSSAGAGSTSVSAASSGFWCQLCLHEAHRTCRPPGGIAPSFTTYWVPQLGQVRIILTKALFRDGQGTVNRNESGLARRWARCLERGGKRSCRRSRNLTASACATEQAPKSCAISISDLRRAVSISSPGRPEPERHRSSSFSILRSVQRADGSACSGRS